MKKYKAVVIGLGNIGLMYDFEPQRPKPSSHVFAYKESDAFELICGIDGDYNKEKILQKVAPEALFFDSLSSALKTNILEDADVISICTPPPSHFELLSKLIIYGVGKVVFCEKPIVTDLIQAKKINEMVQEKKVTIIPNISRRWNNGLRKIAGVIENKVYGRLEKINIRYTRGIYNTGAHLFDLLRLWTGETIRKVMTLNETYTSAGSEKSYSFYFELKSGITGYAEAIDDREYYLFDIDLYFSSGKIEMRNSGDDVFYYGLKNHHLFDGYKELVMVKHETNLLSDACIKNAVNNIAGVLSGKEKPNCQIYDAIYPLYVADALEKSYTMKMVEVIG